MVSNLNFQIYMAKPWSVALRSVALQFSRQCSHAYMEPKLSSYLAKLGSYESLSATKNKLVSYVSYTTWKESCDNNLFFWCHVHVCLELPGKFLLPYSKRINNFVYSLGPSVKIFFNSLVLIRFLPANL